MLPSNVPLSTVLRFFGLIAFASLLSPIPALAQIATPFLFTVAQPDASLKVGDGETSAAMGERGLLLFQDAAFDPGISTEARAARGLVVREAIGTVEFAVAGQRFRSFQQVEVLRALRAAGRVQLAAGGGIRQDWGRGQTLVGRLIAGLPLVGGRLDGNAVFEKGLSGRRDRFDVITTLGWSRALTHRLAVGVEGIGQDLEGFWERDEAEGGARLLVGPSVHVTSPHKRWSFTVAGGPMFHSTSSVELTNLPREIPTTSTRSHFAVLGSFKCVLATR